MTPDQHVATQRYSAVMAEVKIRLGTVNALLVGKFDLEGRIRDEFVFLQLRYVCELIAIGCLLAHGDIQSAQTRKILKQYSAEKIIKTLDRIYPSFYPYPVTMTITGPTQEYPKGHVQLDDISGEYLTKLELAKLWNECGAQLHRGSSHDYLNKGLPFPNYLPKLVNYTEKIVRLLNQHKITLFNNRSYIFCTMNDPGTPVTTAFAAAPPLSQG